jgi:hypothetical protein
MQWIQIVADSVRASRERGDTDQQELAKAVRSALGERSLPPALTAILARAADGKWKSMTGLWRALDEVTTKSRHASRGALWAVFGVAVATLFGFLVAYGC